jgi:RNA polymerase sigma factor (sigma-70 family)
MKEKTVDVHSKVELGESANQIKTLISRLPDIQRTVMHLRDIEQLTYEEIEEATDIKVNAIRVNLSRARKKVRDEFIKMNQPMAEMQSEKRRNNKKLLLTGLIG